MAATPNLASGKCFSVQYVLPFMFSLDTTDAHLLWTGENLSFLWCLSFGLLSLSVCILKPEKSILLLLWKLSYSFIRLEIQKWGWSEERWCNTISFTSWKTGFCCAQIFVIIYKKNCMISSKISSLWELNKIHGDLKKSSPNAKINVWLHYSLGGEPAELSCSRRVGLCTALGSLLILWVCQQSFGVRRYTGLYFALGTAKRSTETPSYKQDVMHKFFLS